MKLITKDIAAKLKRNSDVSAADPETSHNHKPVLKLFAPWGAATWLITEHDPDDPDLLFGLCDLGHGSPELGYVYLPELMAVQGPFGLTIERDLYFTATKGIMDYAEEARAKGGIAA